jgi:hypothetical protein
MYSGAREDDSALEQLQVTGQRNDAERPVGGDNSWVGTFAAADRWAWSAESRDGSRGEEVALNAGVVVDTG